MGHVERLEEHGCAVIEYFQITSHFYIGLFARYIRARDKMLKKSTESTAWRYSALKYSYMPCSRFL